MDWALGVVIALGAAVCATGAGTRQSTDSATSKAASSRPEAIAVAEWLSPPRVSTCSAWPPPRARDRRQGGVQLHPAYRVSELLESVPGLVVTVHSGEGKASQFLARGFNLDHGTDIANFIDDAPINRPTDTHGEGYLDLNFLIPEVLGALEYTKGTYYPSVGNFGDVASVHLHIANEMPTQITLGGNTFGDFGAYAGNSRAIGSGHLLATKENSPRAATLSVAKLRSRYPPSSTASKAT